jgi:hypothetical protein
MSFWGGTSVTLVALVSASRSTLILESSESFPHIFMVTCCKDSHNGCLLSLSYFELY